MGSATSSLTRSKQSEAEYSDDRDSSQEQQQAGVDSPSNAQAGPSNSPPVHNFPPSEPEQSSKMGRYPASSSSAVSEAMRPRSDDFMMMDIDHPGPSRPTAIHRPPPPLTDPPRSRDDRSSSIISHGSYIDPDRSRNSLTGLSRPFAKIDIDSTTNSLPRTGIGGPSANFQSHNTSGPSHPLDVGGNEDKEEGEISEEDERPAPPSHRPVSRQPSSLSRQGDRSSRPRDRSPPYQRPNTRQSTRSRSRDTSQSSSSYHPPPPAGPALQSRGHPPPHSYHSPAQRPPPPPLQPSTYLPSRSRSIHSDSPRSSISPTSYAFPPSVRPPAPYEIQPPLGPPGFVGGTDRIPIPYRGQSQAGPSRQPMLNQSFTPPPAIRPPPVAPALPSRISIDESGRGRGRGKGVRGGIPARGGKAARGNEIGRGGRDRGRGIGRGAKARRGSPDYSDYRPEPVDVRDTQAISTPTPYQQYSGSTPNTLPPTGPAADRLPTLSDSRTSDAGKRQSQDHPEIGNLADIKPEIPPTPTAADDMSPEETAQYMDIIRKLLHDGLSPDQLIERGATPKYVATACAEIVEAQKARKDLWADTSKTSPIQTKPTDITSVGSSSMRQQSPTKQSIHLPGRQDAPEANNRVVPRRSTSPVKLDLKRHNVSQKDERSPTSSSEDSAEIEFIQSLHRPGSSSGSNVKPPAQAIPPVGQSSRSADIPRRLVPSSHWAPPTAKQSAPTGAIKIESYKPASTPGSSSSAPVAFQTTGATLSTSTTNPLTPSISAAPISSTLPARPSVQAQTGAASLPAKPKVPPSGPRSAFGLRRPPSDASLSNQHTSTSISSSAPASTATDIEPSPYKRARRLSPGRETTNLVQATTSASLSISETSTAAITSATKTQAEKNALLETRRKALESMRARRAKKGEIKIAPTDVGMEVDAPSLSLTPQSTLPTSTTVTETERNIAQEVADLEQEVMNLDSVIEANSQQESVVIATAEGSSVPGQMVVLNEESDDAMDLEEGEEVEDVKEEEVTINLEDIKQLEEGEIESPPEPEPDTLPIPSISRSRSSTSPVPPFTSTNRGTKRPGAEDFDSKPVSAPTRTRRKPFGAAQKPHRLLISLDDGSESDSSDDELGPESKDRSRSRSEGGDFSEMDTQKAMILAEHELKIKLLKRQIAARLAAKLKAKENGALNPTESATSKEGSRSPSKSAEPELGITVYTQRDASPEKQPKEETTFSTVKQESMDVDTPMNDQQTVQEGGEQLVIESSTQTAGANGAEQLQSLPGHQEQQKATFTAYKPLMRRYPQLGSTSVTTASLSKYSLISTSNINEKIADDTKNKNALDVAIDENLLSSIVLTRIMKDNPDTALCSAESGGGKCADPSCDALHLDKGLTPTVDDLVNYILQVKSSTKLEAGSVRKAVVLVTKNGGQIPTLSSAQQRVSIDKTDENVTGSSTALRNLCAKVGLALGLGAG